MCCLWCRALLQRLFLMVKNYSVVSAAFVPLGVVWFRYVLLACVEWRGVWRACCGISTLAAARWRASIHDRRLAARDGVSPCVVPPARAAVYLGENRDAAAAAPPLSLSARRGWLVFCAE